MSGTSPRLTGAAHLSCRVGCPYALASALHRPREHLMVFHGIVSAIIVGAVIGGLGRLVLRGKQRLSILMTIVIGIAAALIGTFLAVTLGVANTTRIDWFELFIQVGLAAIGVTLYNLSLIHISEPTR